MGIVEIFQSFFVAVILGYLSLTNTIATFLFPSVNAPEERIARSSDDSSQSPSNELTALSRLYGETHTVASILRDHSLFQQTLQEAAVISSEKSPITEEMVLDSLVNILCEYKTDTYTRTTTGTGYFIGEKGVILTNAHVAQFLLLEQATDKVKDAECTIRTGNPASPRYHAELLFISPTWILNNADLISQASPRGTGEYDYALLYIDSSLTDEPLPDSFPSVSVYTEYLPKSLRGSTVLTAGYPAEAVFHRGTRADLVPKVASTRIHDLYTFGSNFADIFSITESLVGEQGASGGPVIDPEKGAIGLIVTKGNLEEEGARSLRALTLSYIHRTIKEETGFSLSAHTEGDLAYRGIVFKEALAPFLTQLLAFEMKN